MRLLTIGCPYSSSRPRSPPSPVVPSKVHCTEDNITSGVSQSESKRTCSSSTAENPASFHSLNLGHYYTHAQSLSESKKFELLRQSWMPNNTFQFPSTECYGQNRSFRLEWLTNHKWLVYSAKLNGAFCKYCVLFGSVCGKNTERLEKLYSSPLDNRVKATTKFKEHELRSECHRSAVVAGKNSQKVTEEKTLSVDCQVDKAKQRRIEET